MHSTRTQTNKNQFKMKRALIIAIAVTALFVTKAHAQKAVKSLDNRTRFHLGAKVGVNIANVYDVDQGNFNSAKKSGFMGGVFMNIPMGKLLGIQLEGLYSQKGTKATGTINGAEYSLKRTTNSADIPVLLQFKPFRHLSIVAGPQFSYLLSQKDVYDNADNTVVTQQFHNQDLRKANIGVVGGIDINILHMVLSGRVGADLQKNTSNNTLAPSYKNIWGQVGVGFRF